MSIDENKAIIKAYMSMLLDGAAFSNWSNPPDRATRFDLVESIMRDKRFHGNLNRGYIQKVITESKSEEDFKRLLNEMEIKEDEFLV